MTPLAEDYEYIEAKNDLRKKVREVRQKSSFDDPVARAEAALAILSSNFETWMEDEVEIIARCRDAWAATAYSDGEERDAFYRAVHDLKGQATTLGFPLATKVAASLCAILEGIERREDLPVAIIDQHVDAIRAIFREKVRDEHDRIGAALATTLGEVAHAYLVTHGRSPDEGQEEF